MSEPIDKDGKLLAAVNATRRKHGQKEIDAATLEQAFEIIDRIAASFNRPREDSGTNYDSH